MVPLGARSTRAGAERGYWRWPDGLGQPATDYEALGDSNLRTDPPPQQPGSEPLPVDRRKKAEHFRPHNERLYELLGRDYGWQA
jgi:hypothetical protein